jgi:hypothetical protein
MRMNKTILYILMAVVAGAGAWLRFSHSHDDMPIGCDEFGYLNQAHAIETGRIFSDHSDRDFLPGLLQHLRDSEVTEQEFAWMIAPHAYHLDPGTGKVINQYPPGTAFVLSLVPLHLRKVSFPATVILLLVLMVYTGRRVIAKDKVVWFDLVFPIFLFVLFVSAPFTTELARVNSLAFTFGPLLLAGMIMPRYPMWALFLIVLTVNFRIANLVMVAPVLLFMPMFRDQVKLFSRENMKSALKCAALAIVAALPLLLYNYKLLGNPFSSTYSVIDTAMTHAGSWYNNLRYYLDPDQRWLRVQMIVILISMMLVYAGIMEKVTFLKSLCFPLINYAFFCTHQVTMDYYPYVSAMITAGVALGAFARKELHVKWKSVPLFTGIIICAVILVSGYRKYQKNEHLTFDQARSRYQSLCGYDVVWADLYSGTTEYVCGNNGFRYATGSNRSRRMAMKYLRENGISQVLVADDLPVSRDEIAKDLKIAGLEYKVLQDTYLGKLILIKNAGSE